MLLYIERMDGFSFGWHMVCAKEKVALPMGSFIKRLNLNLIRTKDRVAP